MVGLQRKIKKKHWLKCPKAVTKKKQFGQNINDSKFHIWNSFLKNIISVIQPSYICRDVFLFISDFGAAGLKANKDLPKISLVLRRPTHLTLKIICYHNIVKNVSHFTNFSANFCLVSEKAFTLHHFLTPKKCILKAL